MKYLFLLLLILASCNGVDCPDKLNVCKARVEEERVAVIPKIRLSENLDSVFVAFSVGDPLCDCQIFLADIVSFAGSSRGEMENLVEEKLVEVYGVSEYVIVWERGQDKEGKWDL